MNWNSRFLSESCSSEKTRNERVVTVLTLSRLMNDAFHDTHEGSADDIHSWMELVSEKSPILSVLSRVHQCFNLRRLTISTHNDWQ